jgi:hypothetical protein
VGSAAAAAAAPQWPSTAWYPCRPIAALCYAHARCKAWHAHPWPHTQQPYCEQCLQP